MQVGKSSRLQLSQWDVIYVPFSGLAGLWQDWSGTYGSNSISLALLMSFPFALVSYGHASLLNKAGVVDERPNWKRGLVLWAGMPLSLVVCSLTILVGTKILSAVYGTENNLPFDDLRLLVDEGVGSIVWANCLLVWSKRPSLRLSMHRLLALSAVLFVGDLFAYGIATLIFKVFQKEIFIVLTSVVATLISAMIIVFLSRAAGPLPGDPRQRTIQNA